MGTQWNPVDRSRANPVVLYVVIVLVVVSFPLVYHYLGAVRHLAWDYAPDYLENSDVEKSSLALFGAATAISAGTMFL